MSYSDFHFEHVRLTILRLLHDTPTYAVNDSVLTDAVNAMGLSCSRDQLGTNLNWLQEQRLVIQMHPAPGLIVACVDRSVGRGPSQRLAAVADVAREVTVDPGQRVQLARVDGDLHSGRCAPWRRR